MFDKGVGFRENIDNSKLGVLALVDYLHNIKANMSSNILRRYCILARNHLLTKMEWKKNYYLIIFGFVSK